MFANDSFALDGKRMLHWSDVLIVCVAIIIFVSAAGLFASYQSIWLDETTQLTGLALPLKEQLSWLTGYTSVLGVPADRMPPLSYWIGSLWATIFGGSEHSFRWMGIVAICCAVPALYGSGRAIGGRAGGVFILALTLLSSRMITEAVEIRAYPIFFAFAAWATYFFVLLIVEDEGPRTAARFRYLCLFLLLAIYTHFFGIVAASCLLAALFIYRFFNGIQSGFVLIGYLVVMVFSAGIIPFILASSKISDPGTIESTHSLKDTGTQIAQLVLWMFDYPNQLALFGFMPVFFIALAVLIIFALRHVLSEIGKSSQSFLSLKSIALILPLVFGIGGLGVLSFIIRGFNTLAPSYNLWMVPLLLLFMVLAFKTKANGAVISRIGVYAAGIILVLYNLLAINSLLAQPALYSHGPSEWVASNIKNPESTLIIHDSKGGWGFLYFPLYYITHGKVTQWIGDSNETMKLVSPTGFSPVLNPKNELTKFSKVIIARTSSLNSNQITAIARGTSACAPARPEISGLFEDADTGQSQEVGVQSFCAYIATAMKIRN